MPVWTLLLAVLFGVCLGAGTVLWWVSRATDVTADREINGWPAYHVGYLADDKRKVNKRVKAYAVREGFAHWHLWATVDDATPHRVSFQPRGSKSELLEMAYDPSAGRGGVVIPVDLAEPRRH